MSAVAEFKDKIEEMFVTKGLNIHAIKHPMPNVHNAWKDQDGNLVIPTKDINSGLYSVHNSENGAIFNTGLSHNYSIIQYSEAFSSLHDVAKATDIKLVDGGLWGNGSNKGKEAWIQFELPGQMTVGNRGDMVNQRLTAISSHSGKYAFLIALTPYRLFCKNQLPSIMHDAKNNIKKGIVSVFKVKHTPGGLRQIENIGEWLKIVDGKFQSVQSSYNHMLNIRVNSEEMVAKVFSEVFKHKKDSEKSKTMVEKQVRETIARYNNADDGRVDRDSAWNLWNSIESTLEHAPMKKSIHHHRSVLVGSIADRSTEAAGSVFDICSNINTDPTLYKVDTDIVSMMDGIRI